MKNCTIYLTIAILAIFPAQSFAEGLKVYGQDAVETKPAEPVGAGDRFLMQQYCPGGVCPAPQTVIFETAPPVISESVVVTESANCPCCGQPMPASTRKVSQPITNYSATWTFPGDLDSHLMGPPHNVPASQLATMTYAEKLMRHDADHNSTFSISSTGRTRTFVSSRRGFGILGLSARPWFPRLRAAFGRRW